MSITSPNVGMPSVKTMPAWTMTAKSSTHGRVNAGHRSLAYRLTFRAPDRTLTTDEVNGFRDAAVAAAASATGAVQR